MEEKTIFNRLFVLILIITLFILSFLVLKPVLLTVFFALMLSFLFYPVFKKLNSWIKINTLTALLICVLVILVIIIPFILFIPTIINQTFNIYTTIQTMNLAESLRNLAPGFFSNPDMYAMFIANLNTFTNKVTSSIMGTFTNILMNTTTILFHTLLIVFVFFFGLKDGETLINYIKSIFPFSKDLEQKVFTQFKQVTRSVVLGQIIVGVVEGLITGLGFLIFGVENTLALTVLACFFGILPVIGTWIVWVPVDIYLLSVGRLGAAIGILIYTPMMVILADTLIRPAIISKNTNLNPAIILISMIGGLFMFGILGLLFGPLIISYLLLFLEIYRKQKK